MYTFPGKKKIHQVICEIHLILESHDPKGLVHFLAFPPNNY